jgi:hypothetical protein
MVPGWVETRIIQIEQRLEYWIRQIQDLIPQLRAAAQTARNAFSQYQPGAGGGGVIYFCLPTTISGASGSWPSLTPGSQSGLTVYQAQGTTLTSVGTFTVYNWYPAAPSASKVAMCLPDGAGNMVLVAQSCS